MCLASPLVTDLLYDIVQIPMQTAGISAFCPEEKQEGEGMESCC